MILIVASRGKTVSGYSLYNKRLNSMPFTAAVYPGPEAAFQLLKRVLFRQADRLINAPAMGNADADPRFRAELLTSLGEDSSGKGITSIKHSPA